MSEIFVEDPSLEMIKEEYEKDYQQLKVILDTLKDLGLTPIEYPIEIIQGHWDTGTIAIPVANEGAQGIRATRWRGGGLTVSFTNGFEDPKNPKRIEVTMKLREKGIDVV